MASITLRNNETVQTSTTKGKGDVRALWLGILFSLAFTGLTAWAGQRLASVPHLPDQGAAWYYWKLIQPTFWTRAIVWGLYLAHQVTLAQNFQKTSREWTDQSWRYMEHVRRVMVERLKYWQREVERFGLWRTGAIAMLLMLLVAFMRGRALREYLALEWGIHFGAREAVTPRLATLLYQQMLRVLARRGWKKTPAQTPREFVAAIPRAEVAAAVGELTTLYQAARFGAATTDAEVMTALLAVIKERLRG